MAIFVKSKKISIRRKSRGKPRTSSLRGRPKVFVTTYTNEGLKFQMVLGPLKFSARGGSAFGREPRQRGRPSLPVATL